MELKELFAKFILEQEYVKNLAPNTLKSYRNSFIAWERFKGELSEDGLLEFIIAMRRGGLKPGACNVHIRSLNVFFHWLHQHHHTEERYRLSVMKKEHTL